MELPPDETGVVPVQWLAALRETEMVELPEQPGEGTPGGPAVIPEPYPPPDEGNPPEPAIIPEPGPLAPEEPEEGRAGA